MKRRRFFAVIGGGITAAVTGTVLGKKPSPASPLGGVRCYILDLKPGECLRSSRINTMMGGPPGKIDLVVTGKGTIEWDADLRVRSFTLGRGPAHITSTNLKNRHITWGKPRRRHGWIEQEIDNA